MQTFILLLTLWTAEGPAPIVHVVDSNMSGTDCIQGMIAMESEAIELGGIISCEFDYADMEG